MQRVILHYFAPALVFLLILDGVLTYIGIEVLRVSGEGNPVMRYAMEQLGVLPAIIVSRILAIMCMVGIIGDRYTSTTTTILAYMIVTILVVSIIPWLVLIL